MKQRYSEQNAETVAATTVTERVTEVGLEPGRKAAIRERQLHARARANEPIAARAEIATDTGDAGERANVHA